MRVISPVRVVRSARQRGRRALSTFHEPGYTELWIMGFFLILLIAAFFVVRGIVVSSL